VINEHYGIAGLSFASPAMTEGGKEGRGGEVIAGAYIHHLVFSLIFLIIEETPANELKVKN
jgi:hypothetical protein